MKTIAELREHFGVEVLMLGHHYQRPEVLRHCDVIGDSLELARRAAESDADKIVLCGVRFMAESAAILAKRYQSVYLPVLQAGCPMADMAELDDVQTAWARLQKVKAKWAPVVYVNSSAQIKAFCGENNGSACTSGNCAAVLRKYLESGCKIFFLPDEHLAANTAHDLGIGDDQVVRYNPHVPDGGLDDRQLFSARIVVWAGFCHVHMRFRPEHVRAVRQKYPEAKIIVHPESPKETVRLCDAHGSTAAIIRYVERSIEGSTIVIGTEGRLVERLAEEHRGKRTILALQPSVCPNMAKTTEESVAALLDSLVEDTLYEKHPHCITVADAIRRPARVCLDNMLAAF